MLNDIKIAVETISDRQDTYRNSENYYRGSEKELFANAKLARLFRSSKMDYVMNYSKVVVDTVLDRLEIATIQPARKGAADKIGEIFEKNELVIDASEIHRRALVFGDCYAMVWPNEDGDVQIDYNSPLTTVLIYDQENQRRKDFAAKMWETTNAFNKKVTHLNLYYADRVEKYTRTGELSYTANENVWGLAEVIDNPFGEVPVFHFRTHRPYGTPEHAAAIGPQDAINKLIVNHMNTVDYQGAPQRYALASGGNSSEIADFEEGDTARENLAGLKNGPGELWYLDGVTQVGQFQPADPKVFTEPIHAYVGTMAALTQTPMHYFTAGSGFASGEALRTVEAPLIKKIKDRQLSFGQTWREIFIFALKIEGIDSDVQVRWQNAESIDTSDDWQVAQIKRSVGIPLAQVLAELGYDEELIEEIVEAVKKEQEENPLLAAGSDLSSGLNAHNAALKASADQRKQQAATQSQGTVGQTNP